MPGRASAERPEGDDIKHTDDTDKQAVLAPRLLMLRRTVTKAVNKVAEARFS